MNPNEQLDLDAQAEELAAMLDALFSGGSGHVNLRVGEETTVQTVNSTEFSCVNGACAVPTFFDDDEDDLTEDSKESDQAFDTDF